MFWVCIYRMFVSYKQLDKPQIFNYQLFQGIILALMWIFELRLIIILFIIVFLGGNVPAQGNISC